MKRLRLICHPSQSFKVLCLFLLKEPAPIFLDFVQSYCNFGTIRTVIFFWSSFWNVTPYSLSLWKKTSKTCLVTVTTIENHNHPLFELQQQLHLAGSCHLRGQCKLRGEAPMCSEPAYNLVITMASAKDI